MMGRLCRPVPAWNTSGHFFWRCPQTSSESAIAAGWPLRSIIQSILDVAFRQGVVVAAPVFRNLEGGRKARGSTFHLRVLYHGVEDQAVQGIELQFLRSVPVNVRHALLQGDNWLGKHLHVAVHRRHFFEGMKKGLFAEISTREMCAE